MNNNSRIILDNPYAKKKALPELSRKPVHGLTSALAHRDSDGGAMHDKMNKLPGSLHDLDTTTTEVKTMIAQHKENAAADHPHGDSKKSTPEKACSIELPNWQRLPSRMISFGSAEVLTVSETKERLDSLAKLALTPVSTNNEAQPLAMKSSIRVVGKVLHRFIHSDLSVSLVLGDPLQKYQHPKRSERQLSLTKTPSKPAPTPGAATSFQTPGIESSSAKAKPKVAFDKSAQKGLGGKPSHLFDKKKTPVLVFKKRQSGGTGRRRLSFASGVKPGVVSCQKREGFTNKASLDFLCDLIRQHVWVVVRNNKNAGSAASVDDLAMIIGEATWMSSACNKVCEAVSDCKDKVCLPSNEQTFSFLDARIVMNANGTNMKLHTDALVARRAYLQRAGVQG